MYPEMQFRWQIASHKSVCLITDMRECDRITWWLSSPKSGFLRVKPVQLRGRRADICSPNMNPCDVERDNTVAFLTTNLNWSWSGLLNGGPRSGDRLNLGY
jgi:hypothetical protein